MTASSREDLSAALYSIYYRAAQAASLDDVPGWKPLPLEPAARLVRCDPDEHARSLRIRNAAIQLVTGAVFLDCRGRPWTEFELALRTLGIPSALFREVRARTDCASIVPPQTENLASEVMDTVKDLAAFRRTCCTCVKYCEIGPWGNITVANFRVEVNRDSTCVFQAIDPQCWDDVVPLHFENTFVMDTPPCVSNTPACRIASPCASRAPAPVENPMPPTATRPWCGVLTETTKASAYEITSKLDTVLKVRTTQSSAGYFAMEYGLCESRDWSVCEEVCDSNTGQCGPVCARGDCGIQRDCGDVEVRPATVGHAVLFGSKQIQFTDPVTPDDPNHNDWAQIALKVMVEEVATAMCRPPACPGAPTAGCTTTTGIQTDAAGAATKDIPCVCDGPQDPCSLEDEVTPKTTSPFCPTGGG